MPGSDFDAGPDGFVDSSAVLMLMDLVISCDTSMAHLAGALGRPLWIALNHTPEWRWQRERTDSIWYPTAHLFRQDRNGDWDGVFSRMTEELAQLIQSRAKSSRAVSRRPSPQVEISWGELLDRIAILEIRADRATCQERASEVLRELERLNSIVTSNAPCLINGKLAALRSVNNRLLDIQDAMRACGTKNCFDSDFTQLAREAWALNNERDQLKREIDDSSN